MLPSPPRDGAAFRVTALTVSLQVFRHCPLIELKRGSPMKTLIAATLVLFAVSTSAFAFDMPNVDGMDGIQQMMQSKGGKRGQRAQQGEEGQGQQQSAGGTKGMMKGLMNGDISGVQGMMSSFGR